MTRDTGYPRCPRCQHQWHGLPCPATSGMSHAESITLYITHDWELPGGDPCGCPGAEPTP